MIVIATGFIPLTAGHFFYNGYVGKQPMAWKEYCAEYWLVKLRESMDTCIGRRDITDILLKKALNTLQSINQDPLSGDRFLDCHKLKWFACNNIRCGTNGGKFIDRNRKEVDSYF